MPANRRNPGVHHTARQSRDREGALADSVAGMRSGPRGYPGRGSDWRAHLGTGRSVPRRRATLSDVSNASAVFRHFSGQRILVIGDVILDRYWWGEASRLSPEAPVPVVRKQRATVRPGGAANTAANLAALGATPLLVGLVGTDRESVELEGSLLERGVAVDWLIREDARPTTTKTRVIASHQQIVRVDEEDIAPISGEAEGRARAAIAERLESATAVVVSDYAKGFLTPSLLNVASAIPPGA